MRTHNIQQYKKIKNQPMRSPSPDYACRNHNPTTIGPLEQSRKMNNNGAWSNPVQFSHLIKAKEGSLSRSDLKGNNQNIICSTAAKFLPAKASPSPSISPFSNKEHNQHNRQDMSPIKSRGNEDESISLHQFNELLNENTKLKKQLQLYKTNKPKQFKQNPDEFAQQNIQEKFTNQSYMLLKQKVTQLECQLQYQIGLFHNMKKQKNEQIALIRHKNQLMSQPSQNQSNEKERERPQRPRLNSQSIELNGMERILLFGQKRTLSQDKEQIISIYDHQNMPDESLYSEAERVDVNNLMSLKKDISLKVQKLKEHYQQVIKNNAQKYRQNMEKLQSQVAQLKQYLQEQYCKPDDHQGCSECTKNQQLTFALGLEMEKQKNMLVKQLEQQRRQNRKLKELLANKVNGDVEASRKQWKKKGRGLERVSWRSGKSNSYSAEFSYEIFGSRASQGMSEGGTQLLFSADPMLSQQMSRVMI